MNKKLLFYVGSSIISFVFVLIVLVSNWRDSKLRPENYVTVTFGKFLYQKWSFFSTNPIQPEYDFYALEGNDLKLVDRRFTSAKNRYGLLKNGKKFELEFNQIKEAIDVLPWTSYPAENKLMLPSKLYRITVKDIVLFDAKRYLVVRKKRVRWNEFASGRETKLPSECLLIEIL